MGSGCHSQRGSYISQTVPLSSVCNTNSRILTPSIRRRQSFPSGVTVNPSFWLAWSNAEKWLLRSSDIKGMSRWFEASVPFRRVDCFRSFENRQYVRLCAAAPSPQRYREWLLLPEFWNRFGTPHPWVVI